MIEIRAIVRPNRVPQLREALRAIPNFPGMTICDAEGFTAPASAGKRTVKEELTDFTKKVMVTVLADRDMAQEIEDAIISACQTGQIGDGLVWSVPIEHIRRVRNGTLMYPRAE